MLTMSELEQRLAEAREFEHNIGALKFRLRLPTKRAIISIRSRYDGPAALIDSAQEMLAQSVLSVRGATTADLGLPGEPQPLPDGPRPALLYLADHIGAANELMEELSRRSQERFAEIEDNEKN